MLEQAGGGAYSLQTHRWQSDRWRMFASDRSSLDKAPSYVAEWRQLNMIV